MNSEHSIKIIGRIKKERRRLNDDNRWDNMFVQDISK